MSDSYYRLGDRVALPSGARGTLVGILERGEYARDLDAWRWASLTDGVIVLLDEGVFTHVRDPQRDLRRARELRLKLV
jgi:hypothetical protein